MFDRLFIGKKRINLTEVDSTNAFMKQLVSNSDGEVEGLVVTAISQFKGRGQQGNTWESEDGKNLTFSVFLKPNVLVKNQFIISKVICLGIVDFLNELNIEAVKIKWPNDIYIGNQKVAGILIENSLKSDKVNSTIIGVGLNVNQTSFNSGNYPTSILNVKGVEQNLDVLLNQLLFFIEKRYVLLKQQKEKIIDNDYLHFLYGKDEKMIFKVKGEVLNGVIKGVDLSGKLQILINDQVERFDLKEIKFLIS